jgi:hypothetical protein
VSEAERTWARAAPLIEQALEHAHGTHRLEDVMKGVLDGRLQLWVGKKSAAVTEVLSFPRLRALNVFLAAGEMSELSACLAGMEAWARGCGCERIMFSGRLDPADRRRSAWERWHAGWTPSWITLFKELD